MPNYGSTLMLFPCAVAVLWPCCDRFAGLSCLAKVFGPTATMEDLFSVIVDTRTCGLETKHAEASFDAAMAATGVPAGEGAKCTVLEIGLN